MKNNFLFRTACIGLALLLCGCGGSAGQGAKSGSGAASGAAGGVAATDSETAGETVAAADSEAAGETVAAADSEASDESVMSPVSDSPPTDVIDSETDQTALLSSDGKYQILLEDGFEDATGLFLNGTGSPALDYAIRAADPENQAYLLFNAEEKENSSVESFEDFRQLLTEAVTESSLFSDVRISRPIRITLSGTGFEGTVTSFTAVYHPAAASTENGADSQVDSTVEAIAGIFTESVGESSAEGPVESSAEGPAESSVEASAEAPVTPGTTAAASSETAAPGADTGIPVSVRLYALEGVHDYYQFLCWTSAPQAASENLLFDRMVNSLRILK